MASSPDHLLAEIRREIDRIDDGLVDLMMRRRDLSIRVRDLKGGATGMALTPYRPAREAQILRRLVEKAGGVIPAADLVRLWRVILSTSITAQTKVTLHVSQEVATSIDSRLMITEHFCGLPLQVHSGIAASMAAASEHATDLVILDASGPWAGLMASGRFPGLRVAASLPLLLRPEDGPRLIVAARGEPVSSGNDQTILLSRDQWMTSNPLAPLRRWQSGDWQVTVVAGFHTAVQSFITALSRQQPELQLHVAGVIPSPLEDNR